MTLALFSSKISASIITFSLLAFPGIIKTLTLTFVSNPVAGFSFRNSRIIAKLNRNLIGISATVFYHENSFSKEDSKPEDGDVCVIAGWGASRSAEYYQFVPRSFA